MEGQEGYPNQESDEQQEGQTEYLTEQLPTSTRFDVRLQVFVPSSVIILIFVVAGILFTQELASAFDAIQSFISQNLGWFYVVAVNIFLVYIVWLALSRYGGIRLGPDDSEPDFSYFSWFSMLFSAGMGIGLLFFGVAEPISHYAIDQPPGVEADPGTIEAAREGMNVTFLHYGLHAWAIYIVIALALCYFAYRRGLPLTLRSAFYPILGNRIQGWMGDAIDTLAIVGTLFGVATTLGFGVTQINAGLDYVVGIGPSLSVQLLLIAGITAIAVISVVLGVNRGIRRLSLGNILLSGALLGFILIAGPTVFLLSSLPETIGFHARQLPFTGLNTDAFLDPSWQSEWTVFYWGWWTSWSPFVGMFIARISRGRTIREFIAGVLIVPVVVSFLVFTIFGYTAINFDLAGQSAIVEAAEENLEFALFAMLELLPLASITSVAAIIIIATFFITSSDSGSLVDDIHASGGNIEPERGTRVYWAVAEGLVAGALLVAAGEVGLAAFQTATIATGLPLLILMLFICYALVVSLRQDCAVAEMEEWERVREEARRAAVHELHQRSWPISTGPRRRRLRTASPNQR